MFQFKMVFEDGSTVITTVLRDGEEYMVVNDDLELVPTRFGGSSRTYYADGDTIVERSIHPASGCCKDVEMYVDDSEHWVWMLDKLKNPIGSLTVTITIADGKALAPSAH